MNELVPLTAHAVPALVAAAGDRAGVRFLEFFGAKTVRDAADVQQEWGATT
jgi:hypothetical protein